MKQIDSILWAIKVFYKTGKKKAKFITLIYLVVSLIPSLLLLINKKIFETFANENFSLGLVLILVGCYLIFQILLKILQFVRKLLTMHIKHNIQINIQKEIQQKMLCVSYSEYDNPNCVTLIKRIKDGIPGKITATIFGALDIGCMVVQIITALIVLLDIHWVIPTILIVFSVPYIFWYRRMSFENYFHEVNQGTKYRKQWYLIQMLFSKRFNKELKIYNCFDYLGDKENNINFDLHRENYCIAKKYSVLGVILDLVKNIGKAICIFITSLLIMFRGDGIASLTVLLQAVDLMQNCLVIIFSKIKDFSSLWLLFEDYKKFFEMENESISITQVKNEEEEILIEMQNVSFSYPTQKDVLRNINLKIKAGEKVAIVGKNGSGKTTLVNVLLGFYTPTSGQIFVLGKKLSECLADFRKKTVYIMQETPQYSLSIKENIMLGKNRLVNDSIVKLLNVEDIVHKAPRKEQTLLGEENEDQYNLSGGEWVKLGIARNAQKEDPILYVMDEPTAALDPLIESKIFESFGNITKERTTIFVSHRLGMISLADKIIVLDNGAVVQYGTHDSLIKEKGLYYEMYSEQLRLYNASSNPVE